MSLSICYLGRGLNYEQRFVLAGKRFTFGSEPESLDQRKLDHAKENELFSLKDTAMVSLLFYLFYQEGRIQKTHQFRVTGTWLSSILFSMLFYIFSFFANTKYVSIKWNWYIRISGSSILYS